MPQITMDWPEAGFMGFDRVFAAKDLGYQGLPFNWIEMPDQFTFAALDRLLLDQPATGPALCSAGNRVVACALGAGAPVD